MKNLLSAAVLCASLAATSLAAHATTIQSTDSESLAGIKVNGSAAGSFYPAGSISTISWGAITPGDGTGLFAGLVTDYVLGAGIKQGSTGILYVQSGNGGANGSSPFTFTVKGDNGDTLGSFVENLKPVITFSDGTNGSALTLELFGNFTFAGPLVSNGAQDAEFKIAFTQTGIGGGLSGSGTFATPAIDVPITTTPEPSSLLLMGTGLISGVGVLRRRFKA